jgi:hypothetical protein
MKKVSAKMVPRLLTDEQKQRRADVCSDLPVQLTNNFLLKIITGDATRNLTVPKDKVCLKGTNISI